VEVAQALLQVEDCDEDPEDPAEPGACEPALDETVDLECPSAAPEGVSVLLTLGLAEVIAGNLTLTVVAPEGAEIAAVLPGASLFAAGIPQANHFSVFPGDEPAPLRRLVFTAVDVLDSAVVPTGELATLTASLPPGQHAELRIQLAGALTDLAWENTAVQRLVSVPLEVLP